MLIDSHCHLESIKNYKLSEHVLPVTVGYSNSSNLKNIEIAKKLNIPFVLGIAPQTAQKEGVSKLSEWVEIIKNANPKPNAIGEIGLDNHWAKTSEDKEKQRIVFNSMLMLAGRMNLPIVIHARDSVNEVLKIIKNFKEHDFTGKIMMHFFSGNDKEALEAVDIGAYISIPPLHSKERRKVINSITLDSMLVETDAPAVVRLPEDVEKSVSYISEVKNLDFNTVSEQTAKNAIKFFNIKKTD